MSDVNAFKTDNTPGITTSIKNMIGTNVEKSARILTDQYTNSKKPLYYDLDLVCNELNSNNSVEHL